jgi:hypothetical protein
MEAVFCRLKVFFFFFLSFRVLFKSKIVHARMHIFIL